MRTRDKIRLEKRMKAQGQPELTPSDRVKLASATDKIEAEVKTLKEANDLSYARESAAFAAYTHTQSLETKLRNAIASELQQAEIRLGYTLHLMQQSLPQPAGT